MRDMSVKLFGKTLKNPIITSSGTFGMGIEYNDIYDVGKLGGIALKSLTMEPRQGNPTPRIVETASGVLNAVGLQNPGVDAFLRDTLPVIKQWDTLRIANIAGRCIEDYVDLAVRLNVEGVDMLEVNVSCPNVKQGAMALGTDAEVVKQLTSLIKAVSEKPVIVKLTPNVTDIVAMARAAEAGGADAVSLINTMKGMAVDPYTRKPILANVTGGLSGPAIKPVALRMVYEVARAVTIPVIGMGGILSGEDVAEFMLCGAAAVQVGTLNLIEPTGPLRILREFNQYLEQTGAAAHELTGALEA